MAVCLVVSRDGGSQPNLSIFQDSTYVCCVHVAKCQYTSGHAQESRQTSTSSACMHHTPPPRVRITSNGTMIYDVLLYRSMHMHNTST